MSAFFRAYEMDAGGYTPHLFIDKSQFEAWVRVNRPRRMYVRAEGLRGRCRPVIDHRGESSRLNMIDETPMLEIYERE